MQSLLSLVTAGNRPRTALQAANFYRSNLSIIDPWIVSRWVEPVRTTNNTTQSVAFVRANEAIFCQVRHGRLEEGGGIES